ncbi:hypothetical protein CMO90_03225 [Candidatus Woesearchaeota archaeon]|jgi:hypothetical protein|nr:hypothetical protein [Candidatus Woesearchaeota archaeon]|tara:strand:- start:364 stop:714 length:351 start_codon:yes stop_codon:yes gene_type:complete
MINLKVALQLKYHTYQILFFIVFIAFRGLNSEFLKQFPVLFKTLTVLIVIFALFYSIIVFVIGLFMLLTIQTGLWEKFQKDMYEAKNWFFNSKYKKLMLIIGSIAYVILILRYNFS